MKKWYLLFIILAVYAALLTRHIHGYRSHPTEEERHEPQTGPLIATSTLLFGGILWQWYKHVMLGVL